MYFKIIAESISEIRNSIPSGILLVSAAKTRLPEEIRAAIKPGINIVGYNYVQEAERMYREIGLETGLHYVYLGNVTNHGNADTRCPGCGQILIERTNLGIIKNKIRDGNCQYCGRGIAGAGMSYDRNRKV